VNGKDQHFGVGQILFNLSRRLHTIQFRHDQVDYNHTRHKLPRQLYGFTSTRRLSAHLPFLVTLYYIAQAMPDHFVIICNQYSNCTIIVRHRLMPRRKFRMIPKGHVLVEIPSLQLS